MFPFAINNTLKFLCHNNDPIEDDNLKEKIIQSIYQALGSKKNVKVNAIVVIECDNEPKRTLIMNESSNNNLNSNSIQITTPIPNNLFGSISTNSVSNHANILIQQPPLFSTTIEDLQALLNITTSNLARQNNTLPDISNQMNFSFISTQNSSPESCLKYSKPLDNNESVLSSRKRKSEKPTKIPQDSPTESNGLDLTLNIKQENKTNDAEVKLERFFNCSLPVWPSDTSTEMKVFNSQAPPIIARAKKTQSIPGHKKSSKVFNCNQCKLQFNSLNALCKHTFSDHRAFRCTFCSANFTQRSNLQRHSLKHVGFKPFICNVCGKAYYRKDHLVRHIEVSHPGSDPKSNITVKLSSSECLEYLERMQNSRLMEMENTEEDKETINTLCLESIEKSSPLALNISETDIVHFNEDSLGNSQVETNKFISQTKEEAESPGKLQISMDENFINSEINGIIQDDLIPTNLSGNSYLKNYQEQILKNCI